jgi:septum formation protein
MTPAMTSKNALYLASQSPRRRELLTQIGVNFGIVAVDVPEVPVPGESPDAYVQRLAEAKARAGSVAVAAIPVLGADTIVVHRGSILEKPRDKTDALRMLTLLSGSRHQVYSAVSICCGDHQATRLSVTDVDFRCLTDDELERYWASGEPRDKAGSYAIQGRGAVFVEKLNGSYSGVVGLPLAETRELLAEFQVPWWQ